MKKVKIIIERSKDFFGAYADNVEGIYGAGGSIAETKESIIKSIALTVKYNKDKAPAILRGDYELVYKFDVESFLKYYKGIFTNSALERLTGINQRQLQHYASGLKKPRETQKRKLRTALHNLGRELVTIEF